MTNSTESFGVTKRNFLKTCLGGLAVLSTDWSLQAASLASAPRTLRAPSVPLITCDPYFSIWSNADRLTDAPTEHWTRKPHRLTSLIRIDDSTFRIMGDEPKGAPTLPQVGLAIHPTRTIYEFEGEGVHVTLTFMTGALPEDLMILSRPLGYVTWTVRSTDNKEHGVSIYFEADSEIAVNKPSQHVVWSEDSAEGLSFARIGTSDQPMMQPKGDDVRIDWGYLYLAAKKREGTTVAIGTSRHARRQFSSTYSVSNEPNLQAPRAVEENAPVLALSFDIGAVGANPVSQWAMLAYDEIYAVQFFQQNLRPFWRSKGAGAVELLTSGAEDYDKLRDRCQTFDEQLSADARKLGGERYRQICALAYRQCIAGNKIVSDMNGQPLLFPKENTSNGCIGTVDVIYPMAPQFLLFGPSLSKAMLVYNLEYAQSDRWHFPFAPHDVGTFPQANGQVYGGGEKTETNQMPVEETGNMLILLAALAKMDGDASFFTPYWPTIQKWAEYLKAEGFDPKNQLCTDDFAGHLAHNVNLSAKAIVGLGAYAQLCRARGDSATASAYDKLAKEYAERWVKQADDGDHFRLTFDKPGTWSQKYNLVWDRILGLNLFPQSALEKEMIFYRKNLNRYGLPLDSRKPWTKTDWTLWTATLTGSREDFDALISPVYDFVDNTPDRVPFSDFYWTKDGSDAGMHARPVIGGVFLRFLYDTDLWKKWAGRDQTKASNWAPFPKTM
jgi:glutaminase A-like protein/uncharacterized protein DUF5127/uncharacterized protein DUF4964